MDNTYPIMLGNVTVGEAKVTRQGLYYLIACKCQLTGDIPCRVGINCGTHMEKLGMLVPENDYYAAQTRIAASKLGTCELSFCIIPKHMPCNEEFVPIRPEEPFAYLSRLEDAYLRKRENTALLSFEGCADQSSVAG